MSPLVLLIITCGVAALAPVIFWGARENESVLNGLDGFVIVSIGVLVLGDLIPHAVEDAGFIALAFAALGLIAPLLLEGVRRIGAKQTHRMLIAVAMIGLVTHAIIDGVAIASAMETVVDAHGHAHAHDHAHGHGHGHDHSTLGLGVLLHRLPVALGIWWMVRPRFGFIPAALGLIALSLATIIGYSAGDTLMANMSLPAYGMFQAFVAGMLLHVIGHGARGHGHDHSDSGAKAQDHHNHDHQHAHSDSGAKAPDHHAHAHAHSDSGAKAQDHHSHSHDHDHHHHHHHGDGFRWAEVIGGILGGLAVVLLPKLAGGGVTQAHNEGFADRFLEIALETAPPLLLGFALAAVFSVAIPGASIRWLGKGGAPKQALKGTLFGLPLPICSCGVVPVYRTLMDRGVPAAAGMAFLVATPELGIEAVILSVPFLGPELTVARLVAALFVALVAGWLVGRKIRPLATLKDGLVSGDPQAGTIAERAKRGFRFGFVEVVDETAAWLLAGLLVAAALNPDVLAGSLSSLPNGVDILIFAIAGMPMYVCASGATPIAAALLVLGASPGAALAFLLAGPATNVTTFGVISDLHGRRKAFEFASTVFAMAVLSGLVVNLIFGAYEAPLATHEHSHGGSTLQWLCLGVLSVVFGFSLLRQGPREFLGTIVTFGTSHNHDHDHDHGHDHGDHGHDHPSDSGGDSPGP